MTEQERKRRQILAEGFIEHLQGLDDQDRRVIFEEIRSAFCEHCGMAKRHWANTWHCVCRRGGD